MPRPRQRACLEAGLKLDINRLVCQRLVVPGSKFERPRLVIWGNSYTGETVAGGEITADLSGTKQGWFRIKLGGLDQWIRLDAQPRHFGGRQWYFVCPYLNRLASVLWMPPGARNFACRQSWRRQVAYASQFEGPDGRAHRGKAKIKSRLCLIGGFDPDEWDLPPKPKWMRWPTYNRAEEKFDHYEAMLDAGIIELLARFNGLA